jgi:hypothetical protein
MNELLSDNLWTTIKGLAEKCRAKRAAVAYVTTDRFVKFGQGDILVTDASDHAIATGQTSAQILARAHKRGAELYSLSDLHSKVILLDGTAVIGSANLSESSANALVEAAWVTNSPAAVGMVTSMVAQLAVEADVIDDAFLDRIQRIKVIAPGWRKGKAVRAKNNVKIPQHQTWIIAVELARASAKEQKAIEAGEAIAERAISRDSSDVSWIRFRARAPFRSDAKPGDTVIQIWSRPGAKMPESVWRHAPILNRQEEEKCTFFTVRQFADCDDTSISWSKFKTLMERLGMSINKIGPAFSRRISEAKANVLFSMWEE